MPATDPTTALDALDDIDGWRDTFARRLALNGVEPSTVKLYRSHINELGRFLRARGMPTNVRNITREHMEEFYLWLRDGRPRPWSPTTQNQCYRALHQFFAFLGTGGKNIEGENAIERSPQAHIRAPKLPDNPPPTLTPEQYESIQSEIQGQTYRAVRDRALLAVLYDTGVRLAEIAGMKLDDLDLLDGSISVVGSKDKRERRVPFGKDTAFLLDKYLRARAAWTRHPRRRILADTDWLWLSERGRGEAHITETGIYQVVKDRARDAHLPHVKPHLFRHGWAHAVLASGLSEGDAMRCAGWRTRSMVDRYAASTAAQRARENYAPHSPVDKLRKR